MKAVTFIKTHVPFNAGQGAYFENATAEALVRAGYAVYQKTEAPPAPAKRVTVPKLDTVVEK